MSSKRSNGNKTKKYGFYIALGVCLVAVGIAAWSTYDAVDGYVVQEESAQDAGISTISTPEPSANANEYNANEDDGEALKRQETQSEVSENSKSTTSTINEAESADAPVEENDAAETAGTVEEAPAEETYTEQESTGEVQASGTLYEISSIMNYPVESTEVLTAYSSGIPVYSSTMKDWRVHTGTDFKAESGDSVLACANGQVLEVLQDTMLGNTLVVEHGEYVFYYCGLGENIELAEGDIVSAGQEIGTISSVPFEATEEAHLHLEVKQDNVYLNPENVLAEYQG